jgi:uncharacterized protein YggT (Ycf19 family)
MCIYWFIFKERNCMDYTTSKTNLFFVALCLIQAYLIIRFVIKAMQGDVENYNILKLILVMCIPFYGYYYFTKQKEEVS